jgi:hypothetical protein
MRLRRDLTEAVHDVAQSQQLAGIPQWLQPATAENGNEEMDAVAADVDRAADRDGAVGSAGVGLVGLTGLRLGECQGRTVSQRPSQAGALR